MKGFVTNMQNADAASVLYILDRLPSRSPSTMNVNITAERIIEGTAPAINVKVHKTKRMIIAFNILLVLFCLKKENNQTIAAYIIPKCNPLIAIICTTPVLL